jgi:hypothetical protein
MALKAEASTVLPTTAGSTTVGSATVGSTTVGPRFVAPPKTPAGIRALAPERYRLQVTIGAQTLQKLRLAQNLLRHAIPSGDEASILDRALTLLLEDVARKKFAATENPRPARGTAPESRHIPAEVKRAVWLRDLGRCAFVGTSGRRCTEHGFLEFHHVKPFAVGGEASVTNVQLRCRRHNDYEARVFFGRGRSLVPERVGTPNRPAGPGHNPSNGPVHNPGSYPDRARPPQPGGASERVLAGGEGQRVPDRRGGMGPPGLEGAERRIHLRGR